MGRRRHRPRRFPTSSPTCGTFLGHGLPAAEGAEQITDGTSNTIQFAESTTDSTAAELLTPTSVSSEACGDDRGHHLAHVDPGDVRHQGAPGGAPGRKRRPQKPLGGWDEAARSRPTPPRGVGRRNGPATPRRHRCRRAGMPTRRVASSCATGTVQRGPNPSPEQDSSTPIRPSPRVMLRARRPLGVPLVPLR